jgi:hypothetical protein
MKAKERHKRNLIEFIANPENDACSRTDLAKQLG